MIPEERFQENARMLREHLIPLHEDKSDDSLYVRFSEISAEAEELRATRNIWNVTLDKVGPAILRKAFKRIGLALKIAEEFVLVPEEDRLDVVLAAMDGYHKDDILSVLQEFHGNSQQDMISVLTLNLLSLGTDA
jgi:hypothetical protein